MSRRGVSRPQEGFSGAVRALEAVSGRLRLQAQDFRQRPSMLAKADPQDLALVLDGDADTLDDVVEQLHELRVVVSRLTSQPELPMDG